MNKITIEPAFPLGCWDVEMNQMTRVDTEFVSGVIKAVWKESYLTDCGHCFPKRFSRGTTFGIGDTIRCRKSQIYKI